MIYHITHCYVFHIVTPRIAYAKNVGAHSANTVPLVPYQEIKNVEFLMLYNFWLKSMTNQNNQQARVPTNGNYGSTTAKVTNFIRINPPKFLGSPVREDLQRVIDEIKKILGVTQVTRNNRVEFVSYPLKDVAHISSTRLTEQGYRCSSY